MFAIRDHGGPAGSRGRGVHRVTPVVMAGDHGRLTEIVGSPRRARPRAAPSGRERARLRQSGAYASVAMRFHGTPTYGLSPTRRTRVSPHEPQTPGRTLGWPTAPCT